MNSNVTLITQLDTAASESLRNIDAALTQIEAELYKLTQQHNTLIERKFIIENILASSKKIQDNAKSSESSGSSGSTSPDNPDDIQAQETSQE